nr:reverse transcriptase domain-containing protein [Tanacetum cinerariifolium]
MEEMMITIAAFLRGEADAASKKKDHVSWKPQDQSKRHTSDKRSSFRGHSREGKGSNRFTPSPERRKKSWRPKQKETAVKDKPMTIYMVQSWQRTVKQKVTQSFELVKEVAFPPLAASNRTKGPLAIEAEMSGHMIHRMYLDGGSSMEILYEHCFNQLQHEIKSQMGPATTSLTGFSGETIWPLGKLRLLVIIGDVTHSTKAWMNFMIVKSLSPYDGIIGRPGLKAIQAVPSTVHGMLKFPVEGELEERTCPANFKVALHPDFPDQEVVIGGTLSNKARTELCSVLKKNLDIFAWQPSDIKGVSRPNHKGSLFPQLAIQPSHGKETRWQLADVCRFYGSEQGLSAGLLPLVGNRLESGIPLRLPLQVLLRCLQRLPPNTVGRSERREDSFPHMTGVYRYTKVPFGLKNAGATYQRLMDKAFEGQIRRNIEVYVDDLVVKSYTQAKMMRDIEETFRTLRKVNMKLNPKKCSFGLAEGVFLGYVVTPEGIKPCPDKTADVLQLPSPRTIKETLKKCIKKSDFHWTVEAKQAFQQLKQHLAELPLLVAPKPQEELIIYLSITYGAISERKLRKGQNRIKTGQKQEACRSREKFKAVTVEKARKTEQNAKKMARNANAVKSYSSFKRKKKRKGLEVHLQESSTTRAISAYYLKLCTHPSKRLTSFCYDDDDDDDYNSAITHVLSTEEPVDSLSMGDEHLDTIPTTESDEVIKSSVEDLVPIPSEFEAKDHVEIVINSNDDISSSDDDSLHEENIEYVEASPHDSELVSLEATEIVIPKVEEIKDDNLREKLLNVHLLIANIEALKDNPTPSSDCKIKSSSTSLNSLLEETSTFHNSLPEFENFYFDLGEISSGSTTTHSDISISEYDSFIFDFANEEFADELAHIISLSEYDCFYFRDLPDPGELMSILNSGIRENFSITSVNLPIEDDHSPFLAYVVWIFLAYLTYPVIPPYLHPFGNEDTIFDPGIIINRFYSFKHGLSHWHGAFKKFNTHRSHLNKWPMTINGKNIPILDVFLFHFYPP